MGYGTGWDAVWGRDVYGRVFGDNVAVSVVEKFTHDDLNRSENTLIRDYFLGRSHYTKKTRQSYIRRKSTTTTTHNAHYTNRESRVITTIFADYSRAHSSQSLNKAPYIP